MSNFLIIGSGSIANKHIQAIHTIAPSSCFYLLKRSNQKVGLDSKVIIEQQSSSIDEFANIDLEHIIVCSPSTFHSSDIEQIYSLFPTAKVFLEKPISATLADAKKILSLSKDKSIYIGYCLRHHPLIKAFRAIFLNQDNSNLFHASVQYSNHISRWRPHIDFTKSVSAQAKLGGGVLREASHELDLILHLFPNIRVRSIAYSGKISKLDIDTDDMAKVTFETDTQIIDLSLDFCSYKLKRAINLHYNDFEIECDLVKNTIKKYNTDETITLYQEEVPPIQMYLNQMKYFLETDNFEENLNSSFHVMELISEIESLQ